ncbi:hypothetical protein I4U23_027721 [Adineta vaga]|nr:hypothetical protein I4U23_027721 [Adineta vaga]
MATIHSFPVQQQEQKRQSLHFWLPVMSLDSNDNIDFPLIKTKNSLTKSQLRYLTCINRCTLSSSITMDNLISYKNMAWIILSLCSCSYIMLLISLIIYRDFPYEKLLQPYEWFCWCRLILIYFVISSIFLQLASVLGCRPVEVIYDIRYIIMIIVQIVGFIICLFLAFCLGFKYATIKSRH